MTKFVKRHYSGLCISYAATGGGGRSLSPTPAKKNDSRLNRQKRQVHDAVEWMRRNAVYKPLIFCCTVPVQSDWSMQNTNISKFCENIRSNYNVKNYVWVREYTGGGRPHYHFVADSPFIDARNLSLYWARLFGETDLSNSIRMGTNPQRPPRRFFVDSPRMARYLTKYMGKGLGSNEKKHGEKSVRSGGKSSPVIRTFGMSNEVASKSAPIVYEGEVHETKGKIVMLGPGTFNGTKVKAGDIVETGISYRRDFSLSEDSKAELTSIYGEIPPDMVVFDDTKYTWFRPNDLHSVYYGLPKRIQKVV